MKPSKDQSSTSFSNLAFNQRDNICLSSVQKHDKPLASLATPRLKDRDGQEVPQRPTGMFMLRAENSVKPKTRAGGTTSGLACYTINARGCSSNIYGVVKNFYGMTFSHLGISCRNIVGRKHGILTLQWHSSPFGQVDQSVVVGQTCASFLRRF